MRPLVLLLLIAAPVFGQTPEPPGGLKLPVEVKAEPGVIATITADTSGKTILWRVPAGVSYRACCGGKELNCCAPKAGRFLLLAVTAIGDTPVIAECTLIVEGAAPIPPPVPPSPPVPPTPPLPPLPPDPLAVELQLLYLADAGPGKAAALVALLDLYQAAAETAADPDLRTAGELIDAVAARVKKIPALTPESGPKPLWPMRQKLGEKLNLSLPTNRDEALTDATRKQVALAYGQLARAMGTIKP